MKLQPDAHPGLSLVSAYADDYIAINGQRYTRSLVVGASGAVQAWGAARFDDLQAADLAQLAQLDVELVILGTGARHRFVQPPWLQPFAARRVGLETMTSAAACRTYNILAAEGRKVAGAFVIEV